MENNAWFYTFSTSGQVLAALVGLFAVFSVYKLQIIFSDMETTRTQVGRLIYQYLSNNNFLSIEGDPQKIFFWSGREILELFKEILSRMADQGSAPSMTVLTSTVDMSLDKKTFELYENFINKTERIFCSLAAVLVISFVSIAFGIFCLSFPNLFYSGEQLSSWPIVTNLVLIVINLLLIGWRTYAMIKL